MSIEKGAYIDFTVYCQRLPSWVEKNKLALPCPVANDFNVRLAKKVGTHRDHDLVGLCTVLAMEFGATDDDFAVFFDLIRSDLVVEPLSIETRSIDRTLERDSIEAIKLDIFLDWERCGLVICQQLAVSYDRYLADTHGNEWSSRGGLMQYCILIIESAHRASLRQHRRSGEWFKD